MKQGHKAPKRRTSKPRTPARLPARRPARSATEARARILCVYCRDRVKRKEQVHCASCQAAYHEECFEEHGECSVLGCGELEVVRPRRARLRAPRRSNPGRAESLGTTSLILGGLTLCACGLLGPFAISQGKAALRAASASRRPAPLSAQIGIALGWIGCVSVALGLGVVMLLALLG